MDQSGNNIRVMHLISADFLLVAQDCIAESQNDIRVVKEMSGYVELIRDTINNSDTEKFFESFGSLNKKGLKYHHLYAFAYDLEIGTTMNDIKKRKYFQFFGNSTEYFTFKNELEKLLSNKKYVQLFKDYRNELITERETIGTMLRDSNAIGSFERYFEEDIQEFTIIYSPALEGGFGLKLQEGEQENYVVVLNTNSELGTRKHVWHELGHCFFDSKNMRNEGLFLAFEDFMTLRDKGMKSSGLYNSKAMLNEYVVRSASLYIIRSEISQNEFNKQLIDDRLMGFEEIGIFVDALDNLSGSKFDYRGLSDSIIHNMLGEIYE